MSAPTVDDRARYRAHPSVLDALKNPRLLTREVLAGLVVGLALIPEAIAFSVIAGVDPKVGLFSSFIMAVSIAFLGGRPAMVTAATGAVALVIAPVAPTYGLDYFIATVILAGIFQVVLGVLGVAKLMRFIPRSVMVGFVNALAIFVFSSQGAFDRILVARGHHGHVVDIVRTGPQRRDGVEQPRRLVECHEELRRHGEHQREQQQILQARARIQLQSVRGQVHLVPERQGRPWLDLDLRRSLLPHQGSVPRRVLPLT